ncbi:hypothetical protein JOF29_006905 [Kribbella aluminosa]|uniref:Uncharacterized protein n=1 Tax=Kribbella aluminosa TaxID=416017 RepID=A0ABS4UVW3_9ACTN|nr:hypothetical protein [Kribbella aluminosa]
MVGVHGGLGYAAGAGHGASGDAVDEVALEVLLRVRDVQVDSTYTCSTRARTPGDRLDPRTVDVYVLSTCTTSERQSSEPPPNGAQIAVGRNSPVTDPSDAQTTDGRISVGRGRWG